MVETPPPTLEHLFKFTQTGFQDTKEASARGMRENCDNFAPPSKELAATKREAQEGKIQAEKATTLANKTKTQLETVAKRVTQLEKNPPPIRPKVIKVPPVSRPREEGTGTS